MDPQSEYTARRTHWAQKLAIVEKRFGQIGNWRLGLFSLAGLLAWLSFGRGLLTPWTLLGPAAIFIALMIWHEQVFKQQTFGKRALHYYDQALARLDGQWMGKGVGGEQFRQASHLYADDIDLFGRASLFELLNTSRTTIGERRLAEWLLAPAVREVAVSRQQAITELSEKLTLREDLALIGESMRAMVDADALVRWATAPPVRFAHALRWAALVLAIAGFVFVVAFFINAISLWPLVAVLAVNFIVIFTLGKRVHAVLGRVDAPAQDIRLLSLIVERLEAESFDGESLQRLKSAFTVGDQSASVHIRRLAWWSDLLDSGDHMLIRILRPFTLWQEQIAMGIEAWRSKAGANVAQWVKAVGDLEALSCLATFHFERPSWRFPVLEAGDDRRFLAKALQHPLMPASRCIPNDIAFGDDLHLIIISGSNMSGKSTLLRAIGLNTVLAWAGAPVAAEEMLVARFHLGASIRVTDSLEEGRSRFFAEISRIRQVVALAESGQPVLFLFDELFSGTNSHDRRIGASAIVKALVERKAVGLITTHDLALANLEQDLHGSASNMHLDDRFVNGAIEFSYKLSPGVVTHSNALELMRAVGLVV